MIFLLLVALFFLYPESALADLDGLKALTITDSSTSKTYSVSLQILAVMTLLTLLPALLISMTAFTRIIIVLSILRQAIGMAQTPTNQILIGLSLFLTLFVMSPVLEKVNKTAIQPYFNQEISAEKAFEKAQKPLKAFMLNQIRESDLSLFSKLAGKSEAKEHESLPLTVIMPAFLTSELKTAFQIGFLMFLPFLIIDIVVASVLMAMGMMMLSPLIISLPFKVMLFVLVDGWALIMASLAGSFFR